MVTIERGEPSLMFVRDVPGGPLQLVIVDKGEGLTLVYDVPAQRQFNIGIDCLSAYQKRAKL
jgi:hypothetical protein